MRWRKYSKQPRKTQRETLLENKAALEFMAAAGDKAYEFSTPIPPPPKARRPRQPGPIDRPLEKHVLKAALHALRLDPRVWLVDRQQSGLFMEGDRHVRIGAVGHLDIKGMLKGGKYFELEAKRPGEKPTDRQLDRIARVRDGGGISGWFTSVEEALALLP